MDLEGIKDKWVGMGNETSLADAIAEYVSESGFLSTLDEDSEEFIERDEMIAEIEKLVDEQLETLFDEIKQHIKSVVQALLVDIAKIENDTKFRVAKTREGGIKVYSAESMRLVKQKINERFKSVLEDGK